MRAKLEFDCTEPSESQELKRALNATYAYLALFEIDNTIFRSRVKYPLDEYTVEMIELVEKMRQEFFDILAANYVNLDDLD
jgi:hypothetical protein